MKKKMSPAHSVTAKISDIGGSVVGFSQFVDLHEKAPKKCHQSIYDLLCMAL